MFDKLFIRNRPVRLPATGGEDFMVWRKAAVLAVAVCLLAIPSAWADGMDLARQGLTAQRSGSFEEAIRLYDQAVAQGDLVPPDLAVVLTNRGDSWRSLGDVTKAVADYRKAIETDPEIYAGYNSLALGQGHQPQGRVEKRRRGPQIGPEGG